MTLARQAWLLLRKDLLLELRQRDSLLTMFFFGTLLLFMFNFSFDPVGGDRTLIFTLTDGDGRRAIRPTR